MASKRNRMVIEKKLLLIRSIEAGETISDVGRRFGISYSTVATIWKNRYRLLNAKKDRTSAKNLKKPQYEDLDKAMITWYRQHQNSTPVSGPIIKDKAKEFAKKLGISTFKASEGWLGRFKQRYNINLGKINGVTRRSDMNVTHDWIESEWPKLKEDYDARNIFMAVEAGIFYRLTPDEAFKYKGDNCARGNLPNQRLTVLVAANMDGTEKRRLLVIGKSNNTCCMQSLPQMPVTYKSNRLAWMTSHIFEKELRMWDAKLGERKILLLVDNSPAHTLVPNLQNIQLTYLPRNSKSDFRSMEHTITSLKSHFRKNIIMELVESEGKSSIKMLDAIFFLSKAWEEVTTTNIQHSFHRAGLNDVFSVKVKQEQQFKSEDNLPSVKEEFEHEVEIDDFGLTEWVKQFDMPKYLTKNLQTYIEVDDSLATTALVNGESLDTLSTSEEEEDYEDQIHDTPSIKQALNAAKLLEKYFLFDPLDSTVAQDMSNILKKIKCKYWESQRQQSEIEVLESQQTQSFFGKH